MQEVPDDFFYDAYMKKIVFIGDHGRVICIIENENQKKCVDLGSKDNALSSISVLDRYLFEFPFIIARSNKMYIIDVRNF